MNAQQKKTLAIVLGSAFAATVGAVPAAAAENPFALKPLASGYMVADHHEGGEKMKDGKCGAGKCGSEMKKKEGKEGSCGADKKGKEGNCGADKKDQQGSGGADKT